MGVRARPDQPSHERFPQPLPAAIGPQGGNGRLFRAAALQAGTPGDIVERDRDNAEFAPGAVTSEPIAADMARSREVFQEFAEAVYREAQISEREPEAGSEPV